MLLRKKLRDKDLSKRNRKQKNKLKQMQKMKMMVKTQLRMVVKSHLDLKEIQINNLRKMKMTQYLLGLSLVF